MRSGVDHTVLPANHTTPAFIRSSPGGATTEWTVIAPADEAYYSFIDPERMKGWVGLVGWPIQWTVYPYKWLPISCRSGADEWKFADQRPTFYHWVTQPSVCLWRRFFLHTHWGPLRESSSPLWHFKPARVNPSKLAYDTRRPDAGPVATSAFNRLGQHANSNRAYRYAELAVSSLAVAETIASTHCTYERRDGQAE